MGYKDVYTKLDIYRELLANRYMLSTLLVNLYNLMDMIDERDKIVNKALTKAGRKRLAKLKDKQDMVQFENFSITQQQHRALVKLYNPEIVNEACILLDKHIHNSGKTYSNPYKKLKEWGINLALKERLSDYTDKIIKATREVDYRIIEDKELALKYIYATPEWKRSIDEGCIYLRNKFNIE